MLICAFCSAILPILGVAIAFATSRSRGTRALSIAIVASGLAVGVLTAVIGLSYFASDFISDSPGWEIVAGRFVVSAGILLYIGFGVGSVTASLLSVPAALVIAWMRSKRHGSVPDPLGSD